MEKIEAFKAFVTNWQTTITIIIILICAFSLTRLMKWVNEKSFLTASKKLRIDHTQYKFFKNASSFLIWGLAFSTITLLIPALRTLAISLFAGAGILLVVVGFAAQHAFSNIVSGLFIVIFKPFRVGDMIKVGNRDYGIVDDITLRHTVINNFQNKRIIIPNSIISVETIVNDTIDDIRVCCWLKFGISYESNFELASRIIEEEAMKHPHCIDARTKEEIDSGVSKVIVYLIDFGDSSVNLRANVWTDKPFDARQMLSDINIAVKKRFDAEGIEIPYPHRTLVYKTDLPEKSS